MGDYAIRGQFDATCAPADVKKWLDGSRGIAGWWSDKIEGSAGAVGDSFHVTFPTSPVVFDLQVTELSDDSVAWYIGENPPWWKNTTIRFDLTASETGGTTVMFTHSGFDPDRSHHRGDHSSVGALRRQPRGGCPIR